MSIYPDAVGQSEVFPGASTSYPIIVNYPSILRIEPLHPDVLDWRDRAVGAGGIVENVDLLALDQFVKGAYSLGLRDSDGVNHAIVEFLPLAGSNLAAALTKLWYPSIAPIVTNYGFTESHYIRTSGITGDGLSYLNSNVAINSLPGIENGSLSLGFYNRTYGGYDSIEMGSIMPSTQQPRLSLVSQWSNNTTYFSSFNNDPNSGTVVASISDSTKTFIASRYSTQSAKVYRDGVLFGGLSGYFINPEISPQHSVGYFAATTSVAAHISEGNPPLGTLLGDPFYISSRSSGCFFISVPAIPEEKVQPFSSLTQDLMSALGRAV